LISLINFMKKDSQKGVALYMALVILSVLTAVILSLVGINLSQMKVILTVGYSVNAFFAADTGAERALRDRNNPEDFYSGYLDLNNNGVEDQNEDAFYEVTVTPSGDNCNAQWYCIGSVGNYRDIKRAVLLQY